jgi:hypothetical protein
MNGGQIKQAAIQKAKQVAQAANGNGNKKRRKDLKPIITASGPSEGSPGSAGNKCVFISTLTHHVTSSLPLLPCAVQLRPPSRPCALP